MSERDALEAAIDALKRELRECESDGIDETYLATRLGSDELIFEGNRCGLLRLALLAVQLSNQPGNHLHFDEASELSKTELALVLAHAVDPWNSYSDLD